MAPKKDRSIPAAASSTSPSMPPTHPITSTPISGTSTIIPSSASRENPPMSALARPTNAAPSSSTLPNASQAQEATEKKRTRGPSRSKSTCHLIGQENTKLHVNVRAGDLNPYGANASRFASEIGIIIRDYAPLRVKGWSKVDEKDKEVIYTRVKDKFKWDPSDDSNMKNVIESHCAKRYKNHRNKMHDHYKGLVEKGLDPRAHRPPRVRSNEDWEWLCDSIFGNEQWKKRSTAAKNNRSNLPYNHVGGSKSFINHREAANDGLGRIELFRHTHWNAKHGWNNEEAEARYNRMVELRQQRQENNEVADEAAICTQVLGGERNGYIPGLGPTPGKRQASLSSSQVEAQIHQRLGDIAAQMQRERDEATTNLRQQLRNEISEDIRREQQEIFRHLAALLNIPDEHPLSTFLSINPPPPPPPPPPAPAA